MALEQGDIYKCPNSDCGCEIKVIKGAAPGKGGDKPPSCCCGKDMIKK